METTAYSFGEDSFISLPDLSPTDTQEEKDTGSAYGNIDITGQLEGSTNGSLSNWVRFEDRDTDSVEDSPTFDTELKRPYTPKSDNFTELKVPNEDVRLESDTLVKSPLSHGWEPAVQQVGHESQTQIKSYAQSGSNGNADRTEMKEYKMSGQSQHGRLEDDQQGHSTTLVKAVAGDESSNKSQDADQTDPKVRIPHNTALTFPKQVALVDSQSSMAHASADIETEEKVPVSVTVAGSTNDQPPSQTLLKELADSQRQQARHNSSTQSSNDDQTGVKTPVGTTPITIPHSSVELLNEHTACHDNQDNHPDRMFQSSTITRREVQRDQVMADPPDGATSCPSYNGVNENPDEYYTVVDHREAVGVLHGDGLSDEQPLVDEEDGGRCGAPKWAVAVAVILTLCIVISVIVVMAYFLK